MRPRSIWSGASVSQSGPRMKRFAGFFRVVRPTSAGSWADSCFARSPLRRHSSRRATGTLAGSAPTNPARRIPEFLRSSGIRDAMQYWLVKSEPEAFSWADQVRNGTEPWTGVRNHAARNNLAAMKRGDRAFFYHSNTGKEIVGVVEVVREAYPDPTAADGPWVCVDMRAVGPM